MSKVSCPICVKAVLDSEDGVICDGDCARWFHRDCLKMPKSEYQRLSGDSRIKWTCNRTDCLKNVSDSISGKLDTIIATLQSLATKTELADGLDAIKKDLDKVTHKLDELEPRLSKVEAELFTLREKQSSNDSDILEDFISESNDRNRRSKNIIIHNIPELNNSPSLAASKEYDASLVRDFLVHMKSQAPTSDVRHFRLGRKPRDNKSRPLVICLVSEKQAVDIFKNFNAQNVPVNLQGISLSHDRTPRERKYLEQLRTTLKTRQEAGEENLTIKFISGVPTIVSKNV